jgi:hypothetical protein
MEHFCAHTLLQDVRQPLKGGRVQHVVRSQNGLQIILGGQWRVSLVSPRGSKNALGQPHSCVTPHITQLSEAVLAKTCCAVATLKQAASKVAEHDSKLRRLVTGLEARVTKVEQVSTRQPAQAGYRLNESLRANRNDVWYRNDIYHLNWTYAQACNASAITTQDSTSSKANSATWQQFVSAGQGAFNKVKKGGGCSRQQSCTNAGEMQPTKTLRKLGHSGQIVSGARLKHIYPIHMLRLLNQFVQKHMRKLALSRQPSCLFVLRLDCGHRSISGERAGRDVSLTL